METKELRSEIKDRVKNIYSDYVPDNIKYRRKFIEKTNLDNMYYDILAKNEAISNIEGLLEMLSEKTYKITEGICLYIRCLGNFKMLKIENISNCFQMNEIIMSTTRLRRYWYRAGLS